MKPMIWHPEEKDSKVGQYLDRMNREPWVAIIAVSLLFLTIFSIFVLLGVF